MQKGVSCPRGLVPHEECRRCAQDPLHPCSLTPDMLEQMRGSQIEPDSEDEDREQPGAFTPSRLLGCDRRAGLEVEHDTWLDIEGAYKLYRGHMVHHQHAASESYPGAVGTIREMRFQTEIETRYGPQRFTGQPDLIVVKSMQPLIQLPLKSIIQVTESQPPSDLSTEVAHLKIVDYKSTGKIGHDLIAPRREHVMQVNMYAWLVARELPRHMNRPIAVVVDELEIVYEDMDKARRFSSAGALQARGKRLNRTTPYQYETLTLAPVPQVPLEQVEAWVVKHIESRLRATTEVLPPPLEGEAAWICRFCPLYDICHQLAEKEAA